MPMMTGPSTTARQLCVLALAATAAASACRRDEPASPPSASPSPSAPPPPVPPPAPAAPPTADDQPAASDEATDRAIVGRGRWSENQLYKFRLERVAACGATSAGAASAPRPGPDRVSQFKGETSWVGALFSLEAKGHLFASPRDLELRRGGVILNAAQFQEPPAGCAPLLLPRDLRAGDRLRGFALFEVPKRFRTEIEDPIVFSYRPTRWGGARRVEVPIPECFDACPEPSAAVATGKTAGRSRPEPRQKF